MRTFALRSQRPRRAMFSGAAAHVRSRSAPAHDPRLGLQASVGNRALQRWVQGNAQCKLALSQPGDEYEEEADRVAGQVMRVPEPGRQGGCACGGACGRCKAGQAGEAGGRMQMKRVRTDAAADGPLPPLVQEVLQSPGQQLDSATRAFMESRFDQDFSGVRVHSDGTAARAAAAVEARAYTVGEHVVFGAGEYVPGSDAGRSLIAHELAHVVQQGGAREGERANGLPAADDASEVEAGRAATASGLGAPLPGLSPRPVGIARASWGEMWDAFWGVGPIDAYRANKIADEALAAAQRTGLPGLHNGPADAWRHCFWNCRMTDSIGADQAETIASNHEADNPGPVLESMMDLHNNAEGRACGGTSCDSCCQSKLDSAQLVVIDSASGALVPSSATPRASGTMSPVYKNY